MGRVICFDKRGTASPTACRDGRAPDGRAVDGRRHDGDRRGRLRARRRVRASVTAARSPCCSPRRIPSGPRRSCWADTFARMRHAPDYPDGLSEADAERKARRLCRNWGRRGSPSSERPGAPRGVLRACERSPGVAIRAAVAQPRGARARCTRLRPRCRRPLGRCGSIRVPTLVFHRRDNTWIPFAFGRYLADHIADARFVEIDGVDHFYYQGDSERILSAVQEFVTGERRGAGGRSRAGDGAVHRHRRVDREGSEPRRPGLARSPRAASRAGAARRSRTSAGARSRRRERVPGAVRRAGARRALRARHSRCRAAARARGARGGAHGRVRADGGQRRRDRRAHRRAHRGGGGSGRGARVEHRQGSRGRLGAELPGPRESRAQGRRAASGGCSRPHRRRTGVERPTRELSG